MKPRTTIVAAIMAALLVILAALVANRALAVNEPPELIIPQAPAHAAVGLHIAPVPPETVGEEPNAYPVAAQPTWDEVLEAAMQEVPDELVERGALLAWGEYSGTDYHQQTAPLWCVLNRADAWGKTPDEIMHSDAFHGLLTEREVPEEWYELAREVFAQWALEKQGYTDVGRTLGAEYLYFTGNGNVNIYRTEYTGGAYCIPTDA